MIFTDQNLRDSTACLLKQRCLKMAGFVIHPTGLKKIYTRTKHKNLKKAALRMNRWPKTRAKNKVVLTLKTIFC